MMMRRDWISRTLAAWACLGLLVPRMALGVETGTPRESASIADVALDPHGTLHGQIVDATGLACRGLAVQVAAPSAAAFATTSGPGGEFRIAGLRGGAYQLTAAGTVRFLRLWTAESAPPSAARGIQVVTQPIIRGQTCDTGCQGTCGMPPDECSCGGMWNGGMLGFLLNPILVGTAVAAAIAIPLALSDDQDASS